MRRFQQPGLVTRMRAFVREDLWDREESPKGRLARAGLTVLRVGALLGRGYSQHHLTVRASALTYITLVSIVPTLAVAFAMFAAFGGLQHAQAVLLPKVLDYLTVGVRGNVEQSISQFISNIHSGAVGGVGTVFLFLTAVFLISSMENAFNEIWGVTRDRPFYQSLTLYWTILTITPTLLAIGMAIPAMARKMPILGWGVEHVSVVLSVVVPLAFTCLAFSFMYKFLPNTHVRVGAALVGGCVGGALWFAAVYGYAWYARNAVDYSKIYGPLGAIPIFLMWMYLTWLIILFGAELSFATQHVTAYRNELRARHASQSARELLALRIMQVICGRFVDGSPPVTCEAVAEAAHAPVSLVNDVVRQLSETGLVLEMGDEHALLPARDPHQLSPPDVLDAMQRCGESGIWSERDAASRALELERERARDAARQAWAGMTFADLAHGIAAAPAASERRAAAG